MNTKYLKKLLFLSLVLLALFTSCDNDDTSDFTFNSPIALADPFILVHNGVYYAYGTVAADGIAVFQSNDMKLWKKESKLALDKANSWGDRWFWAPEVYYVESKNKFFMYYSVDEHIAVATSDSPTGPFVQESQIPMLSDKAIDNSLFIDDDGQAYLYFTRFSATDGSVIWGAKLNDDYLTINQSTMKQCLKVSQSWEVERATVNEAPFMVKHNGVYYLTYSANHYENEYYGVGYATSDSPLGTWVKYAENPILQKPKTLEGAGHSAIFKDLEGKLKIVFHAHHSPGVFTTRYMYISDVTFGEGSPAQMVVSTDYQTPRLIY